MIMITENGQRLARHSAEMRKMVMVAVVVGKRRSKERVSKHRRRERVTE